MRRSLTTVAVAAALASTLVVAGCSSKDDSGGGGGGATGGSTGGSSALSIQPLVQIDNTGKEVAASDASGAADPAGDGSAKCSDVSLAMAGALTGGNAALGLNIYNGAKLAVDEHNKANADCQVTLKKFDTEGDPQKATQVAPTIVSDKTVLGLLGPAFSGETKATGGIFKQAGLLSATASATNPGLTTNGWSNFFRGLGNDNSQGAAIAKYMTDTLGYKKVCVVADNQDYSVGLADVVTKTLGSAADKDCAASVKQGDTDFSATVQIVKSAQADAVYYAGYYQEAAPFVSQLRSSGVTLPFISDDGTNDPEFVKQAGDASKDAYLTCPCGPAPSDFATKYQASAGKAPGVYSVEAYDLVTIMLKAIDSGVTDRADMVKFFAGYDGQGVAKHYKWDSSGELASTTTWVYQVK
ncbi:branched-chain amino acid ABC transporter substrate-binding protein [Luteimicrobium subarcticum]|uniref:Branched-chain amino acid transport system substrate-binding protein n=1 Tax=Luteimicrobium subarcticum TaxID=620910 RepID=A0A2M8WJ96_9MICO|nr:branched-chain amino acid ABC transporter substrate-binding protein [Luteimicrobium subarcticum]PJI90968.1 branched-chain amino acid transport system substrate-binding protein [Luteimicrobium subarcticum]